MNEDFSFVPIKTNRGKEVPGGKILMKYCAKSSRYQLYLNRQTSKEINDRQFKYLRLSRNNLTGEIYLIFTRDATEDAVEVRSYSAISVYSKALVEYIMEAFRISREEADDHLLSISANKSVLDGALVYQIINK